LLIVAMILASCPALSFESETLKSSTTRPLLGRSEELESPLRQPEVTNIRPIAIINLVFKGVHRYFSCS
jgi:hypothetical protein